MLLWTAELGPLYFTCWSGANSIHWVVIFSYPTYWFDTIKLYIVCSWNPWACFTHDFTRTIVICKHFCDISCIKVKITTDKCAHARTKWFWDLVAKNWITTQSWFVLAWLMNCEWYIVSVTHLRTCNTESGYWSSRNGGWIFCLSASCNLTHCGLVTPYGDIDLDQHWLR